MVEGGSGAGRVGLASDDGRCVVSWRVWDTGWAQPPKVGFGPFSCSFDLPNFCPASGEGVLVRLVKALSDVILYSEVCVAASLVESSPDGALLLSFG